MNAKHLTIGLLFLVFLNISIDPFSANSEIQVKESSTSDDENLNLASLSCTIFTATIGDKVFYGNSEDIFMPGSYFWFSTTGYDTIYFGYDNNNHPWDGYPMGAMNEKGLCIDMNALPSSGLIPEPDKPTIGYIVEDTMQNCDTVEEVITWCLNHNFGSYMDYQLHFADATGDAVVVSAGADRKLAFTRIGSSNFLVSTNWNLANSDNALGYPCYRYETAVEMLREIDSEENLTVQACSDTMEAVQMAASYCNILNLKNRDIYLYYPCYFPFDVYVKLNLHELIASNTPKTLISSLFPPLTTPPPIETTDTADFSGYTSIIMLFGFTIILTLSKRKKK